MSRVRFQSKANGLVLLKGKWLKADAILILIALMLLGITLLEIAYRSAAGVPFQNTDGSININMASWIIELVFTLILLLFIPPLITGQAQWYWSLSDPAPKGIGEVFGWFGSLKLYIKSVGVALGIFIRGLLWAVLTCGIPVGVIAAAFYYFPPASSTDQLIDSNKVIFYMLMVVGVTLLIGGLFLLCFIMMRYFLAVYLIAEDSSRGVHEVIKTSRRYTKGQRWELMKFCLTFILWFLQLYFIIPAFFVLPYFNSSTAVFAKHLIYAQRARERAGTDKAGKPETV